MSQQHYVDKVGEFHLAFKYKPKSLAHNILLRLKLLWEEFNEWQEAKTKIDELDALSDMLYIAAGTLEQYDPLIFTGHIAVSSEPRELKDIMQDIDFCTSFNKFLNLHVELINTIIIVADSKNYDIYGAFNEVHRSNMSKLDDMGKPVLRSDGKIMKGPNYSPPNLDKFTVKEEYVPKNGFDNPTE